MKKGFTLVELLVVIAIVAILTGIISASLSSTRAKARDGKRISDISQIGLDLELYYEQNRVYPTAIYGDISPRPRFEGIFNSTTPKDPNGSIYIYSYGPALGKFHLGAVLEQVSPSAYNTNADFDSSGGGLGFRAGFHGDSTNCKDSTTPDKCYDVKSR